MPVPDASQYTTLRKYRALPAGSTDNPLKKTASYSYLYPPSSISGNDFLPYGSTPPPNILVFPSSLTFSYATPNLQSTRTSFICTLDISATFGITLGSIIATNGIVFTIDTPNNNSATANPINNYVLPTLNNTNYIIFNFRLIDTLHANYNLSSTLAISSLGGGEISLPKLDISSTIHSPFHYGGSISFKGQPDSYICAGNSNSYLIPAPTYTNTYSDFTISWWQFLDGSNHLNQSPHVFSMGSSNDSFGFAMIGTPGIINSFKNYTIYIGGQPHVFGGSSLINNSWHHITIIQHSGSIHLYVDGSVFGTIDNSGVSRPAYDLGSSFDQLFIGQRYTRNDPNEGFLGQISKFVFDSGNARYTSNFRIDNLDPSLNNYTVLALNVSDLASIGTDSGPLNTNITFHGNTINHTPGFVQNSHNSNDIPYNTVFNEPANILGENATYCTRLLQFTALSAGSYNINYPNFSGSTGSTGSTGKLYNVLSTSTELTFITDSTSLTPSSFSTGNTISLSAGQTIYLIGENANNGYSLDLTIS